METKNPSLSVFVVNLDADRKRLHRFKTTMDDFHVPFERWSATPGSDLDARKFGRQPVQPGIFVSGFRHWSTNEAACGVSHIRLLQHITRRRLPWSIIMEDDGILTKAFPLEIRDWDLPDDAEVVLLNKRASIGPVRSVGSEFIYGDVAGGAGTESYLISLNGARKLLRILYPFRNPLDFQMYAHFESIQRLDRTTRYWQLPLNPRARDTRLKAYRIEPSLVSHSGEDSSIGNMRHPRAHLYCKLLLGMDFRVEANHSSVSCRQWMSEESLSSRHWMSEESLSSRHWMSTAAGLDETPERTSASATAGNLGARSFSEWSTPAIACESIKADGPR